MSQEILEQQLLQPLPQESLPPSNHGIEIQVLLWDPVSQLKNYRYTLKVQPTVTIQMLKHYLAPMLSYLPEHLDLLLSKECPYPLAEKMPIASLHPMHRILIVQPCGPMLHSFEPYVKPGKQTLDLQKMAATDIPYLAFWVRAPTIHHLELSADHPRAAEILKTLQDTLGEPNSIQSIQFRRSFAESYAKMHTPLLHKEDLEAFRRAIPSHVQLQFDAWIVGSEEAEW